MLVCAIGFRTSIARQGNASPGLFFAVMARELVTRAQLCSNLRTSCEVECLLDWVRASTRELSVCAESKDKRLLWLIGMFCLIVPVTR